MGDLDEYKKVRDRARKAGLVAVSEDELLAAASAALSPEKLSIYFGLPFDKSVALITDRRVRAQGQWILDCTIECVYEGRPIHDTLQFLLANLAAKALRFGRKRRGRPSGLPKRLLIWASYYEKTKNPKTKKGKILDELEREFGLTRREIWNILKLDTMRKDILKVKSSQRI